jgi:hypothetical protein
MALKTLLATITTAIAIAGAPTAQAGPPVTPPAAPTDLQFDGIDTISWTDNSIDEDGFVVRASVYYSSGFDVVVQEWLADAGETSLTLPMDAQPLCPSVSSVTYEVLAFNAGGLSEPASLSIVVDCPPAAPSNATVAGDVLSWTDNSNNENGFRITAQIGGETLPYEVELNVTSFVLPEEARLQCPDRASVGYLVTAFNTFGESEAAGYAVAATCGVEGPTPTPTPAVEALPDAGDGPGGSGGASWWLLAVVVLVGVLAGERLMLRRAR